LETGKGERREKGKSSLCLQLLTQKKGEQLGYSGDKIASGINTRKRGGGGRMGLHCNFDSQGKGIWQEERKA